MSNTAERRRDLVTECRCASYRAIDRRANELAREARVTQREATVRAVGARHGGIRVDSSAGKPARHDHGESASFRSVASNRLSAIGSKLIGAVNERRATLGRVASGASKALTSDGGLHSATPVFRTIVAAFHRRPSAVPRQCTLRAEVTNSRGAAERCDTLRFRGHTPILRSRTNVRSFDAATSARRRRSRARGSARCALFDNHGSPTRHLSTPRATSTLATPQ
jgi:hypothetical protein